MNRFEVRIPAAELDLPLTVMSGQTFRWRRFEVADSEVWEGVDGSRFYRVSISQNGSETAYEVSSNGDEAGFQGHFRLDLSLSNLLEGIKLDHPELTACVSASPGLRVLQQSNPEEVFFTFLCTPNNNVERIRRMVGHLESFGEPIGGYSSRRVFPVAEIVAALSEEELRSRAFGYRARTIPSAARQLIGRGPGWLEELKSSDYSLAHDELCRIDGIGPKLADCICLFGLDFPEAVPVDTHIWQVACREYFPDWSGKSLTQLRYREIGNLFRERFGRNAGLVHQYLFYENLQRYRSRGSKSRAPS